MDFPARQEADDLFAKLDQRDQPRPRHLEHLHVPAVDQLRESQHFLQPLACDRADGRVVGRVGDAGAQRIDRGIDLAFLAAGGDPRRHFPDVGFGLEMIAAVAEDRHPPDQVPGQQFLDRIGDVGARHAERLGDVVGGHRGLGEIEQAVDLADRAVDAPLVPHIAPVQDEPLDRGREFLFAGCFCHDRNI